MQFHTIWHYGSKIIGMLFPERKSGKRQVFDFSDIPPPQFAEILPKARIQAHNKSGSTIITCLSYKDPLVRTLVWHIKTKKDRYAFACAGFVLGEKLMEIMPNGKNPIIIPMPIHRKRLRERGYNQCELLVNKMNCSSTTEVRTDILFRNIQKNNEKKQAFKSRSERIAGIKGSFLANQRRLHSIPDFKNRLMIIVDDVLTTGSTMSEAITTLRSVGCEHVIGLALAH